MGVQKNHKNKKTLKSRQFYKKNLKLGTPGAAKVRPNCEPRRNFLHPGPEMGQKSSRGPKRVAQGVQKVPKGFKKVPKSHEKAHSTQNVAKPPQRRLETKHRCSDRRHRPLNMQLNIAYQIVPIVLPLLFPCGSNRPSCPCYALVDPIGPLCVDVFSLV